MYLDHPNAAKPYLKSSDQAPYILFDSIKSNLYPGDQPNEALWETLSNIIPYYQKTFGIDGARIDMGHALPQPLVQRIIANARNIDPDFALIAEELQPKNAQKARDMGYNIIVSNGFIMQPRIWEGKTRLFYEESRQLAAPVFAAAETHDTPRLVSRDGGERLVQTLTVLNHFMPNGVPFINAGLEFYEPQPMNLGLDATAEDQYRLDPSDPYYGKLALFDRYQLHYLHPRRHEIPELLKTLTPLRQMMIDAIVNPKLFVPIYDEHALFVGFGYLKPGRTKVKTVWMILGNLNPYHEVWLKPSIEALRKESLNEASEGRLLFSTHEGPRVFTQFYNHHWLDLHLGPGEVKIVEF
jgi:glycosidase